MDTTKGEEIVEVARFPNRDLANMIEILKSVIKEDKTQMIGPRGTKDELLKSLHPPILQLGESYIPFGAISAPVLLS